MIHSGPSITVELLDDGIAELKFDLQGESVNKFDKATVEDLAAAVAAIKGDSGVKGVIVTSGYRDCATIDKTLFYVIASITLIT